MTDERWKEVVAKIKDSFTLLEEGKEELEDRPGTREFVCFRGPGEKKMKLERLTYPPVVDKKTIGSRRIGGETHVEYTYSDTDMIQRMQAFVWDDGRGEWAELKGETEALF